MKELIESASRFFSYADVFSYFLPGINLLIYLVYLFDIQIDDRSTFTLLIFSSLSLSLGIVLSVIAQWLFYNVEISEKKRVEPIFNLIHLKLIEMQKIIDWQQKFTLSYCPYKNSILYNTFVRAFTATDSGKQILKNVDLRADDLVSAGAIAKYYVEKSSFKFGDQVILSALCTFLGSVIVSLIVIQLSLFHSKIQLGFWNELFVHMGIVMIVNVLRYRCQDTQNKIDQSVYFQAIQELKRN